MNSSFKPGREILTPRYRASALILAIAIAFIAITAWQLAVTGPFSWHVKQPESVQGGIEAIALLAFLATAQRISDSRFRLIVCAILGEIYLRRHAVDFAVAIDLIYLEILIGLGAILEKFGRSSPTPDLCVYLRRFVTGLLVWSTFAWSSSALGYGSVIQLRFLTIALGLLVLVYRPRPLSAFVYLRANQMPAPTRALIALLLGWLFILFAKTNVSFFFDSLWYGLREDHVLVAGGSAYVPLGLTSVVYYYPKLFDLLLVPVSGLGNAGVITGMTLMMFSLLALTAYELLKQLGLANAQHRLFVILATLTIPAIANTALDAKPDLLAAALVMMTWLHANIFLRRPDFRAFLWMLCCAALSVQAKLTAVPYAGVIIIASILIALFCRKRVAIPAAQTTLLSPLLDPRLTWMTLGLTMVVTVLVTARTIVIAGVPTIAPDPLLHLWFWLGFKLTPPASTMSWFGTPVNWGGTPQLFVDLLFRPQVLEHNVISWTGNVWLWLTISLFLLSFLMRQSVAHRAASDTRKFGYAGMAPVLAGLWLLFGVAYGTRGSDGNYYIAAIVPGMLLLASAFLRRFELIGPVRVTFLTCLALFAFFQAWYCFLSASWAQGTRALDMNFSDGIHMYAKRNRALLAANGLGAIEHELRNLNHSARIVSCVEHELDTRLPATTENFSFVKDQYGTLDRMLTYFETYKVEFLIVPKPERLAATHDCEAIPLLQQVAASLDADPLVKKNEDKNYILYDLTKKVSHIDK